MMVTLVTMAVIMPMTVIMPMIMPMIMLMSRGMLVVAARPVLDEREFRLWVVRHLSSIPY